MLTREITFYCQQGLSITQAKQLNRLAGMFKSTIRCANLTRRQTVAASNQLSLLTLATQPGDLCQLQIEGCDAELAHMAFTCWCGELGQPLVRPRTAALAELRLANALPDPVPEEVQEERFQRFMELQQQVSIRKLARKVGQEMTIIIDEVDEEGATGRSFADAPEIDGLVYLNGETGLKPGDMVKVRIDESDEYDLWASLIG